VTTDSATIIMSSHNRAKRDCGLRLLSYDDSSTCNYSSVTLLIHIWCSVWCVSTASPHTWSPSSITNQRHPADLLSAACPRIHFCAT